MRLSFAEIIGLVIGGLFALGGLRPNDPFIFYSSLILSWGMFLFVCVKHEGRKSWRMISAGLVTAIFLLFGARCYFDNTSATPTGKLADSSLIPKEQPTIYGLYGSDFDYTVRIGTGLKERASDPDDRTIGYVNVCLDDRSKSKFLIVYLKPPQGSLSIYDACRKVAYEAKSYVWQLESTSIRSQDPSQPLSVDSKDMPFTGKVYIYYEGQLTLKELVSLGSVYQLLNLSPDFRGWDYVMRRSSQQKGARQE